MTEQCDPWPVRGALDRTLAVALTGAGLAGAAAASHAGWIFTSWAAVPLMYGASGAFLLASASGGQALHEAGTYCDCLERNDGNVWTCAAGDCRSLRLWLGTLSGSLGALAGYAFDVAWSSWAPGWGPFVIGTVIATAVTAIESFASGYQYLDRVEACAGRPPRQREKPPATVPTACEPLATEVGKAENAVRSAQRDMNAAISADERRMAAKELGEARKALDAAKKRLKECVAANTPPIEEGWGPWPPPIVEGWGTTIAVGTAAQRLAHRARRYTKEASLRLSQLRRARRARSSAVLTMR